jgi:glyoxylase-like metal-dependent hydrolase (beta-lactamase superfamily II)
MKQAHRPDLFVWSQFDQPRNLDFHSLAWIHPRGNVLIDPLPMSEHDRAHLETLGGAASIVITNSDHTRAAQALAEQFHATLCGPRAERERFPFACTRWLGDGDEVVEGLRVFELGGSKTSGELALVLEGSTLITGDLVRCHVGGTLNLLPEAKLSDAAQARDSLARLVRTYPNIETVLVGDGWPLFSGGASQLRRLSERA